MIFISSPNYLRSYYESHPDQFDFDSANSFLAGLGIGLLATTAISLSSTLADIPLAGAEVTRLAFRLGVLVDEISLNLQPRDLRSPETPDSWAYVIPNVDADVVQKELDAIHTKEVTHTPCSSPSKLAETNVNKRKRPRRVRYLLALSVRRP